MTTEIDKLRELVLDDDTILEPDLFDFDIPLETRIDILNNLDDNTMQEDVRKLCCMYDLSRISLIEEFLIAICKTSNIHSIIKTECGKCLCNKDKKFGEVLYSVIHNNIDLSIPYLVDSILFLMETGELKEECLTEFMKITNDISLDDYFRYKSIINIEKLSIQHRHYYIEKCMMFFLFNENNTIRYRILSAQYILQYDLTQYRDDVCRYLYNFGLNEELDNGLRADASDMLLTFGNDTYKKYGEELIRTLANENGVLASTIYKNAENVHSIDKDSVNEIIEFLMEYRPTDDTFESVRAEIEEENSDISLALDRIDVDRTLYGKFNITIRSLFLRVWKYINSSEHKVELKKRLIEELIEMSGKCTSGYVTRLVNILSGFENFSVKIPISEQIISKLMHQLNSRLLKVEDEEYRDLVLEEMTVVNVENRLNFFKFFRDNLSDIRESLWDEFKDFITQTDFDLYFRRALMHYEGY